MKRTGGDHDSDTGYSASALRKIFLSGCLPAALMPKAALSIGMEEIDSGRGPVSLKRAELAILSRLRSIKDFSNVPGTSEGLESRFIRYVKKEPSVASILTGIKTKRYPMSRLRRMLICASLGISVDDVKHNPPYARVLAMNSTGKNLLAKTRKKTKLPIITKPASVYGLNETAVKLFELEAAATDLYVLAYQKEEERSAGQEWRKSPIVI
jgi:predicted nucleotidyltransferase